jgi:hypothetical protein
MCGKERIGTSGRVARDRATRSGIPQEILSGEFDHSDPYPDDNGIRFKPAATPVRSVLPTP